jgi:hypothetical protein
MDEVETTVESSGTAKKDKGPGVLDVVRKILNEEGEGKLAQVGPYIQKDTESEQGFVDYTHEIERKACLAIGRCPKRTGVMSSLESFIAVPQATAYKATPYFFWRSLDPTEFDADHRLLNNHWEPMVLAASNVVFSDGILDLTANTFKTWVEVGHRVFGPKIMMKYQEVLDAKETEQFKQFKDTLEHVLPDHGAQRYFRKVMGSIIRPHVNIKKSIFIQGPAGSRKSTIATAILCAPAGVGGYSIEDIDTLADRPFAQANLIGRWANLSDDPDGKTERWVGWLKRYTGSSIMRGEHKFHQSRNYPITAKLIVCCNTIPRMGESSDAVWSRLCVFHFERGGKLDEQFKNDTADNTKLQAEYWCDKATRACMLKWLLDGVKDGIENGMQPPDAVRAWNETACGEADPVRGILLEEYEPSDETDFVPVSEVRAVVENAGQYLSPAILAQYVRTLFNARTGDRQTVKVGPDETRLLRVYSKMKRRSEK